MLTSQSCNKKSDSERAQAVQHKLLTMVKRQCTWLVDVAAAEDPVRLDVVAAAGSRARRDSTP